MVFQCPKYEKTVFATTKIVGANFCVRWRLWVILKWNGLYELLFIYFRKFGWNLIKNWLLKKEIKWKHFWRQCTLLNIKLEWFFLITMLICAKVGYAKHALQMSWPYVNWKIAQNFFKTKIFFETPWKMLQNIFNRNQK